MTRASGPYAVSSRSLVPGSSRPGENTAESVASARCVSASTTCTVPGRCSAVGCSAKYWLLTGADAAGQRRPDVGPAHPALNDEREDGDRAGQQDDHGAEAGYLHPDQPRHRECNNDVDHVQHAVEGADDVGGPRIVAVIAERHADEAQDDQHAASHVRHDPVGAHAEPK